MLARKQEGPGCPKDTGDLDQDGPPGATGGQGQDVRTQDKQRSLPTLPAGVEAW